MAITLVGVSSPTQRGIEAAETGINVESFSCRYYPQFKDKLNNYQGQVVGFAIPDKPSREVSVKGEVTGSATGLMAAAFATAQTFGNDVNVFGTVAGGFYMDEVTEEQTRDGWRSVDFKFSNDPLVT